MKRNRQRWTILVLLLVGFLWGSVPGPQGGARAEETLAADDAASAVDQARAKQSWAKHFNGPSKLSDYPGAMVVDAAGNVYVTGETYSHEYDRSDIVTLKYSASGRRLWTATYHEGDLECYGLAIALTQEGQVYVTGGRGNDCITLKYSSDGQQLWAKRYRPSRGGSSEGDAVAVDPQGNAYVATSAWQESSGAPNISVVKYSPGGELLWECSYDTPVGYAGGSPNRMVMDAASNVYVVGVLYRPTPTNDMVTLRCDADGRLRWVKRYDGPAGGLDAGVDIALDPSGNVVVTGFSEGIGTETDFVVIKYKPGGKRLWEKRLNGPGNGIDRPYAIATDASGNIYVTGYMFRSASALNDIATVKYSPNGSKRWVKYYGRESGSIDTGEALVVDREGNVYVVGQTESGAGVRDFTTIKYSKQGNRRWVKHYDGPANAEDEPLAIGLDAAGSVYVTGYTSRSNDSTDITTVKYTQ